MSNTPPADDFKPRSAWGRTPAPTITISPSLPSAARPAPPRPQRRPASSILSGSALPLGPAAVAPRPEPEPAPEPAPPPIEIHPATHIPEPGERMLDEVTIFAPRKKKSPAPWLIGGAVAAAAVAGAAFMLRPQEETPVEAAPLAPVAAAPAPAPVVVEPPVVAEPQPVTAPARRIVSRPVSRPRAVVQETATEVPPPAEATPAPQPQPVTPAPVPAPATRLESIVPTPIQPQPPLVRPPVDPNAPLETNDSY